MGQWQGRKEQNGNCDEESNGDGGKSDGNSDKEGEGKGGKRDGDGDKEGDGEGKGDGDGN
jgi:hypothetical protein